MAYCKLRWFCLFWLGLSGAGYGQFCDKGGGGFTINDLAGAGPYTGCAPLTVTLKNTVSGAESIGYYPNYTGETNLPPQPANTSFTYDKPGKYVILQVGSSAAQGITLCREVVVKDVRPPKARAIACSNGRVRVVFEDDSVARQYDQLLVDWSDGSPPEYINKQDKLELDHTYQGAGTRSIKVQGVYVNNPGACPSGEPASLQVEVKAGNPAEKIAITQVDARANGSVGLSFDGVAGVESEVVVKTGAGAYRASGVKTSQGGKAQLTLQSLDPGQVHCIKLRSVDACGNVTESNEVCTTTLNGQAESERNVVTWSQYPAAQRFTRYELLRNDSRIKTLTSSSDLSFVDNNVSCGVAYRYQVVAVVGGARSLSAPVELTATSDLTPSPVSQAIVSVEQEGSVSLVAFPPAQGTTPAYRMVFERAEGPNGGFQEVGVVTNTNRFSDLTAATSERSYCYRVLYENACGNRSDPSPPVCTIHLRSAGGLIGWTGEAPFTDNVGSYLVIKLNSGGASSEVSVGSNLTYDPQFDDPNQQEFNYQIRARSRNGAFLSFSNVILYRREAALFLPDAFSPNGDGVNDLFRPNGTFFDNFRMVLYNRWGQPVYQTTSASDGWDGTINGSRAPEGPYVYKVTILDSTGREYVKSGTVRLLR